MTRAAPQPRVLEELPREVRTVEHAWIPMPDGTRLAARLWIPEDAERDPVPAILEYIPYRLRDGTRLRDEMDHGYFAGHGCAGVRVDLRGSGDSEGVLCDEYLEQELADGEAVLAWLAEQPWCNGRVGMIGISWGGFNGLQLAARQPPQLQAVVTVCSTDDRYADDVHYMGGCLLGDNLSWASTMFAYNSTPPDPGVVGDRWRDMWMERLKKSGLWLEAWLRHQHRDGYWKHASVCEDLTDIQCPVLAVSGWADGYSNAVFRLLTGLQVPCKGLIGPWSHRYPHDGIPGPAIDFLHECQRWWDRWLKDEDNGVDHEPALRAWMQDSIEPFTAYADRPGRWVAEDGWPSDRIRLHEYTLGAARLLPEGQDPAPPDAESRRVSSPLSLGLFAGKWCSYSGAPDLPGDQRQEDGGALVFDTPALPERLEILGGAEVELEVVCDRPVAMLAARLSDLAPDGTATRVTYGLRNLTHRDSHEHPEPLPAGEPVRIRMKLNDVAHAFPAGHRIRLALSTSYFPLAWPAPEPVSMAVSPTRSRLVLPVRPPRDTDASLRPLGEPTVAPHAASTPLETGRNAWLVHRDLARDVSTLEVVKDEGRTRLDEIGTEVGRDTREWYSHQANDPLTARGEVRAERTFRRDGWAVRTVTRTILTCDARHFRVRAELDAYEDSTRVWCRSWDRWIPRDLV
ncbi:CocE/NonD family hydrolase [bacterium]|nr:CocE/NonD family hydrolase [bacterium]